MKQVVSPPFLQDALFLAASLLSFTLFLNAPTASAQELSREEAMKEAGRLAPH